MMLFKSKHYPYGMFQVLWLTGNHFNFKKSIGFWKHPTFMLGAYAEWSLRLMFIEIKKWLPEVEVGGKMTSREKCVERMARVLDDRLVRVFDPKDAEYKNARLTGKEAYDIAEALYNEKIR